MLLKHLLKFLFFVSLSFAAMEGSGGYNDINALYEKVLKPNFEKIAPLQEFAKKRQNTYIFSAILAVIVFALFVKYFKLTGAVIAMIMIAGGIYYLKNIKPVLGAYQEAFGKEILSPIANYCCGYQYKHGKISRQDIEESKIFAPRIKTFDAKEGLFVKEGVKFGYVDIQFDTKEDASVERFAANVFSGFVIVIDHKNPQNGALVSALLKQKVADIDPEFSAFFTKLPRKGEKNGFELFGEINPSYLDRCYPLAQKYIAVSFMPDKTYIYYYQKTDPLDASIYKQIDLQSTKVFEKTFQDIDAIARVCLK